MKDPKRFLIEAAMTMCGMILALTPLAIWASPTKSSFYYVLAFAGTAIFGILTLAQCEDPPPPRRHPCRPRPRVPASSDGHPRRRSGRP